MLKIVKYLNSRILDTSCFPIDCVGKRLLCNERSSKAKRCSNMKSCQHFIITTFILIALQYVKFVSSASIHGGDDKEGENRSNLNQLKDGKLDDRIMAAIEQYASQALEQKLPEFFPTTSETASHRAAQLSSTTLSMDARILQAVRESVAFHLDKMLATLKIEKRTSYVGQHSYAMAMKSPANPAPLTPTSASALPARPTSQSSSEEKRDDTSAASFAASQKGKSVVQHNRPPAESTGQRPVGLVDPQDERTLLIVPVVIGGPTTLQLLEQAKFNLEAYGVIRKSSFVGGALLCECYSAEAKRKLEDAVSQLETVQVRGKRRTYSNAARLQKVPIAVDGREISQCVFKQFGIEPENVGFIPYHDSRKYRLHAVSIYVDDELLEAMKERPYLIIRGTMYDIDTSTQLTRCLKCKLLGHKIAKCGHPFRETPKPDEDCIDCTFYNEQMLQLPGKKRNMKLRPADHPTDDDNCPSRLHFISRRKFLRSGEESTNVKNTST